MSLETENEYLKNQLVAATQSVDFWRNRYQSEVSRYTKLLTKYSTLVQDVSNPGYQDDMEAQHNNGAVG